MVTSIYVHYFLKDKQPNSNDKFIGYVSFKPKSIV